MDTNDDTLWRDDTVRLTKSGLAATTRVKPLFPVSLARLSGDRQWDGVAQLIRRHVADVVEGDGYAFADFYENRLDAVEQVARQATDSVLARRGTPESVVAELVAHRLRAGSADRAGRRLARPTASFDLVQVASERGRMTPIGKQADDLLAFSDHEIAYYLTWQPDGELVVEMTSRGGPRRGLGEFEAEHEAYAALVRVLTRQDR